MVKQFRTIALNNRLGILLVLLAVIPLITVAFAGYSFMFDYLRSDRVTDVGETADSKHRQLVLLLNREQDRALSFLTNLGIQCGGYTAKLDQVCVANLVGSYLTSEGAQGITLRRKGMQDITIGASAVSNEGDWKFLPGQLAKFAGTGSKNNQSYFVMAIEPFTRLQLAVTYPSASLQPIFDRPIELGDTGETFLVDADGYFITPARYPSAQGNDRPITASSLQACLGGKSDQVIGRDYRDVKTIHGFRNIPEIGSGCIMANIDEAEALAPLAAMEKKLAKIILAFLLPVALTALYIARRIKRSEASLRASENKFHLLFESANDCLMVLDLDGRIQDINRVGHQRLGYARSEMVGQAVSRFDPPEFAGKVPARVAEIYDKGQAVFESAHVRKDGSVMPVEVNARLVELDGERKVFSVIRDITERKKEEEQFRMMIRTSLDGFWITNNEGRFLEVNDAYCQLVGYSREELLCMGITDVEAMENPEETAQHIRKIFTNGSDRFETRHRAKDGRIIDVEVSALHTSKYGGRFYCFLHDLTKRKRAEELLREQRDRLEEEVQRRTADLVEANEAIAVSFREIDDLYQNAPCGYHSTDINGKIVRINEAELQMLGYTRAEIAGMRLQDLLTPESLVTFSENFKRMILEGGQIKAAETAFRRKDGSILYALINASAIRDEEGRFVMSRATVYDITERKQAAQTQLRLNRALRLLSEGNTLLVRAENEQNLLDSICRLVVETGDYLMAWVGFAENDAEKTVVPVARSGHEEGYLSYIRVSWDDVPLGRGTTGTAIRTGATQVNHNIQTSQNMAPWREAALKRGYHSNISLPILIGGSAIGALTIYALEPDAFVADEIALLEELASNLAYGIETLRVRAMKMEADKELDNHRRNLEGLIEQRTAELFAAKIEAERANNAKSRFLAAASHDLRQPLSALKLYTAVLKSKLAPGDKPLLTNMEECVSGLSDLLSKLLDLSKLEAGVLKPRISYFPIDDMFDKVLATVSPEAESKGLHLRCGLFGLTARTDPVLYQRIVANLVSNAIQYTERGGVLIACRRHRGKMWIEVWDTGVGIPPDKTGEIFEEFKQLGDEARTRGSGLGLAIVARTADLLGLEIRVHSRPGRGSMFAVELPLSKERRAVPRHTADSRLHGLRIAVVEDNPIVLNSLVLSLQNAGQEVVAAAGGKDLLERLGTQPPDVMVCDYRLAEGETGFDVITSVRALFGSELPAVIITGDTDPRLMRSMARKGIVIQHKPVEFEDLRARIDEAINKPDAGVH